MRQYSLCGLNEDNLSEAQITKYTLMIDFPVIYLGEIPNMLDHCVVSGVDSGKVFSGFHLELFKELTEDEV